MMDVFPSRSVVCNGVVQYLEVSEYLKKGRWLFSKWMLTWARFHQSLQLSPANWTLLLIACYMAKLLQVWNYYTFLKIKRKNTQNQYSGHHDHRITVAMWTMLHSQANRLPEVCFLSLCECWLLHIMIVQIYSPNFKLGDPFTVIWQLASKEYLRMVSVLQHEWELLPCESSPGNKY